MHKLFEFSFDIFAYFDGHRKCTGRNRCILRIEIYNQLENWTQEESYRVILIKNFGFQAVKNAQIILILFLGLILDVIPQLIDRLDILSNRRGL